MLSYNMLANLMLEEMYSILDAFALPYDQLHAVPPKGGYKNSA